MENNYFNKNIKEIGFNTDILAKLKEVDFLDASINPP